MKKLLAKKKLRPYQVEMVKYGRRVTHPCFFVEMRLGKTLATIRTIKTYPECDRETILIVAPFSAWDGWKQTLEEEEIPFICLSGTTPQRIKCLNIKTTVYITNYESWRGLKKHLIKKEFDIVVLDESDMIKNPNSKVSKFYTTYFRRVKHRFILTGTPDPESDLNFVQQILFSDKSVLRSDNYFAFRKSWCMNCGFEYIIRPNYREKFRKLLADHCFFLKRKDVGMNDEFISITRRVEFDAKAKKIWQKLVDLYILESKEDEVNKKTDSSGAVYTWLRQLSGGFADSKLMWNGKLKELLYLLSGDLKHEQVIVWASFRNELAIISNLLSKHGITNRKLDGSTSLSQRTTIGEEFKLGKFRVLIANPEVTKYGADYSVSSTQIFYSLPISGKTYQQAKDRTIAVNKKEPTLLVYLITNESTDEIVYDAIINKGLRSDCNYYIVKKLYDMYNS